jgi:hypothetical protein
MDKAMRLDGAKARRSTAVLVFEPNALAVAARTRNRRKQIRINARAASFQGNDESVQGHDTVAEPGRQDLFEFEESAHGGFFGTANATLCRCSQSECHGNGFIVIQQERG